MFRKSGVWHLHNTRGLGSFYLVALLCMDSLSHGHLMIKDSSRLHPSYLNPSQHEGDRDREENTLPHFCLLFVCRNELALPSHLTQFSSTWPGIPVKHQKCYCCRTAVLTLQHASDSHLQGLLRYRFLGPILRVSPQKAESALLMSLMC